MKTYQILTPLLILALSLSACGSAASSAEPTDQAAAMEAVYTAAAATLFAQAAYSQHFHRLFLVSSQDWILESQQIESANS